MWRACYSTMFSAAHRVPGHPKGARIHGHDFRLRVCVCSGGLDERGFVIDYYELRDTVERVAAKLDHTLLNEVMGSERATAEDLVAWLWSVFEKDLGKRLCVVEVCGPPDFCVELSRSPR